MRRAARILGFALYLYALLTVFSTLGCNSPIVDPSPVPAGPPVLIRTGDVARQPEAMLLWEEVQSCTGPVKIDRFPIDVNPEFFDCGGVTAAGCYRFTSIEVWELYFADALWHEYIHLAMHHLGMGMDYEHTNPIWARCDGRNQGKSGIYGHGPVRLGG